MRFKNFVIIMIIIIGLYVISVRFKNLRWKFAANNPLYCFLQRTFEFNMNDKQRVKEDVGADVKDNYVQYNMKDNDTEVWVIDDFNRVCTFNILVCSSHNILQGVLRWDGGQFLKPQPCPQM